MASSQSNRQKTAALQLSSRLHKCWDLDLDCDLLPNSLAKVRYLLHDVTCRYTIQFQASEIILILFKACHQVGVSMSMPALAVLAELLLIVSFSLSHSVVEVEGTDWVELVLLWISICMPTGSGTSSICKYLWNIVCDAQANCGLDKLRKDGGSHASEPLEASGTL